MHRHHKKSHPSRNRSHFRRKNPDSGEDSNLDDASPGPRRFLERIFSSIFNLGANDDSDHEANNSSVLYNSNAKNSSELDMASKMGNGTQSICTPFDLSKVTVNVAVESHGSVSEITLNENQCEYSSMSNQCAQSDKVSPSARDDINEEDQQRSYHKNSEDNALCNISQNPSKRTTSISKDNSSAQKIVSFSNVIKDRRHSLPSNIESISKVTAARAASQKLNIFSQEANQQLRVNFPSNSPTSAVREEEHEEYVNLEEAFMFVAAGFFELDIDQIKVGPQVAFGAFASVSRGNFLETLEDGFFENESFVEKGTLSGKKEASTVREIDVAIKIQPIPTNYLEQANMLGELAILRALCANKKYDRLVKYFGAAIIEEEAPKIMIVMELCVNGAVREALQLNLSWPLRIRIASDVAVGLEVLHSNKIIHRDVKTTNVLIDSTWRAKLCDFNLAIYNDSAAKFTHAAGTTEFMSPEALLGSDFSYSTDMFGLGIMMVEMITKMTPGKDNFLVRRPNELFLVDLDELDSVKPDDVNESLWRLTLDCLDKEPEIRPTADVAYNWLDDILKSNFDGNIELPNIRESIISPRNSENKNIKAEVKLEKMVSFIDDVEEREGHRLHGFETAAALRQSTLKNVSLNDLKTLKRWATSTAAVRSRSFRHLLHESVTSVDIDASVVNEVCQLDESLTMLRNSRSTSLDTETSSSTRFERPALRSATSVPTRSFFRMVNELESDLLEVSQLSPSISGKALESNNAECNDSWRSEMGISQYRTNLLERIQGLKHTAIVRSNIEALRDPIDAIESILKSSAEIIHDALFNVDVEVPPNCCGDNFEEECKDSAEDGGVANHVKFSADFRTKSKLLFRRSRPPLSAVQKVSFTSSRNLIQSDLSTKRNQLELLVNRLAASDPSDEDIEMYASRCRKLVEALDAAALAERRGSKKGLQSAHKKFSSTYSEVKLMV